MQETYEFHFSSSSTRDVFWLLIVFSVVLIIRYGLRYLALRKRLRDIKARHVVVAQYDAPPDIPPAFFGTITDNRTSVQDFAATVLWLHTQGYLDLRYDPAAGDYVFEATTKDPAGLAYEHQKYAMEQFTGRGLVPAAALRDNTINLTNQFNFLVLRDLQHAGFYHFHKRMDSLDSTTYYLYVIGRALVRGLVKPWNWPGFLIALFYPAFGVTWLVISVFYYNRLGLYNYRLPQWEQRWPELAGYYNYLRLVEADKRAFAATDKAGYKAGTHDAYLASALLLPGFTQSLTGSHEIAAGGPEYNAG